MEDASAFGGVGSPPPMSFDESLTVTKAYSVAGQPAGDTLLIRHRPYRAPHHNIRSTGLAGGGQVPGLACQRLRFEGHRG